MSIADKLTTIAENEPKVYEAGQKAGRSECMDAIQGYGNRKDYSYAFYKTDFNALFYPKYDIAPTGSMEYFARQAASGEIFDFAERVKECDIVFDTSKSTNVSNLFYSGKVSRLPEINVTSAGYSSSYTLFGVFVETVDKFVVAESNYFVNTFGYASALKNIVIEGVIARSINFSYSPLTVDSMKSVISCLKNYAGTDNDGACTVQFTEACWEALEASGAAPDGNTWKDYVNLTLGWSI